MRIRLLPILLLVLGAGIPCAPIVPVDVDITVASWNASVMVGTVNGIVMTIIADSNSDNNARALKALIPGKLRVRYWPDTMRALIATNGPTIATPMPTPCPGPSPTTVFIASDLITAGNWKGVYGSNGYSLVGNATSYPSYAQVVVSGQVSYTWAASTTDTRAPQKVAGTDRIAATWYSSTTFAIDVNITDGASHKLALYCLDWDSSGRAQKIDVVDATSSLLLDSRIVSSFQGGQYVVWSIAGHVNIRVTQTGGPNAVVSAIYFDGAIPTPSPTPTSSPTPVPTPRPTVSPTPSPTPSPSWDCTATPTLINCVKKP